MTRNADPPLIILPGLAADAGVLTGQQRAFPQLVVPEWIKPERDESLSDYCRRFARQIDPAPGSVIGGVSFGGIVAMEIAQHVDPACVILIGSVRHPAEMPRRIKVLSVLGGAIRYLPVAPFQWAAGTAAPGLRPIPSLATIARQLRAADPDVVRWSLRQVLGWRTPPEVSCPVYQVHGARDFVFPASLARPQKVLPTGGHLISITHPAEVNAFIRECLQNVHRP